MRLIKRKKNKLSGVFKTILLALFVGCVFVFFFSLPLWNLQEVTVTGARLLIFEDIVNIANLPKGENIFLIRFASAQKELQSLSQIKKVKIVRRLPQRVEIVVLERVPFAVALIGDRSFVIDREGVLLDPPSDKVEVVLPDISALPVVSGLKEEVLENKFQVNQNYARVIRESFDNLFRILKSQRIKLEMGRLDDISLLVEDVLLVKLGRPEALEEKMENFKILLSVIGADFNRVEYVDLRFINDPVIKFRN